MPLRTPPPRFAVAFSLAGEQRHLILPIAQEVEAILGQSTVFYDAWYEHWTAGQDADLLLQKTYTETELVVVCVSAEYGDKPWPRAEHRALRARLMRSTDRNQVFPVRVGNGEVEGVLATDIVPDVRDKTARETADLIVARLNLARGSTDVVESSIRRWPVEIPQLQWPMADHGDARRAFASLLCGTSHERALLMRGASETGKSHMSKQMIRNTAQLPGIVSGRLDFKGTTNIGVEIEAFSGPLGIDSPGGRTLNERLAKIFTELRSRATPTLLVFDTYEAAGEAKEWIETVLLPYLVYAPWLRIVVIGQTVPTRVGTIWESVAASTLTLQVPGPEDWFEYSKLYRRTDLQLEFVMQAHELVRGKASVLAGLLGPSSDT
jgi:hypothetical protein